MLRAHLQTLRWQKLPPGVVVDYCFVADDDTCADIIHDVLGDAVILESDERPADATYEVADDTHRWNVSTFEHLAIQKQKLIGFARQWRYDYFWLVDSDLLMDAGTLSSLIAAKKEVISAVFWTQWQRGVPAAPGPNVWLRHPYEQSRFGWPPGRLVYELGRRQLVEVAGGGACCLFNVGVLDKLRYHPRLLDLPDWGMWQGEDRTMAVLAERYHIKQWADGWPDIFHAYHPDMRTPETLTDALAVLGAPRQRRAAYGDMVSFTLEALEEGPDSPPVHIRGRLGGVDVLPEIEAQLLDMEPGGESVFNIRFPPWYPEIPQPGRAPLVRAGHTKTVRLVLHDIKPFSYAPVLGDVAFAGIA